MSTPAWFIGGKPPGGHFHRMFDRPFGYWRTACWRCPSGSLIGSLIATAERRT